jgi:N-hydroxyarylamine O-acetyltransferase
MSSAFDLDAYLERIRFRGERAASLDTLREIHRLHPLAIPFENLDPLLGQPVRLDIDSLQEKLVRGGRGGYCYEQNLLLRQALETLGFRVTGLAARVLWNQPEDAITARSHMLLSVDLPDGPYVADVGFGNQTPTAPLRLEPDLEQATPHEPYRLLQSGDYFVMQARIRDDWKTLYRLDLAEQFLPDYEVSNWYVSTHPQSLFTTNLIAGRPVQGRRCALLNNELAVHHLDGGTERRTLASAAELRDTLETVFGLQLPEGPELDGVLGRLTAPSA